MSAPPLKGQRLTCRNKHRHPDEIIARAAAMDAITRYGNVQVLYVYLCPECRGWHLSKKGNALYAVTKENPVAGRKVA
jgi:hypothetical protein